MSPPVTKGNKQLAIDMANSKMGEYHAELAKWSRNVDKRYAWVVLLALWVLMASTLGPYRVYGLLFAKIIKSGEYDREEASWPVSTIFTVENVFGPIVSVIAYYISKQKSMLVGSLLLTTANVLAGLSRSLLLDVLSIGLVQGLGWAFIFMPFMAVINSYFLRYRNLALGIALCGGTMSIFGLAPIFQWLLEHYHWRYCYFGFAICGAIGICMVPLLKDNPKPEPPNMNQDQQSQQQGDERSQSPKGSFSKNTFRALSYQNSIRRLSTITIARPEGVDRKASVISINPFASSVGMERKISRVIGSSPSQQVETMTMSEVVRENENDGDFNKTVILEILKTPAFHIIWFTELCYYWVFSIFCLVAVDYAVDRGCTSDQAETMLSFQSIGELIGRLVLTIIVDLGYLANKTVVILALLVMGGALALITQVTGYVWMCVITVFVLGLGSLIYILLNGLLVDYLGETKVTIGYGMASCISGVLLIFRPQVVGYCRDTLGSYDPLMLGLSAASILGAICWLLEPFVSRAVGRGQKG